MFTFKFKDQDGIEHLQSGEDVRVVMDGKFARLVGWHGGDGKSRKVDFPTTVYVMNDGGATVAKYVVIGNGPAPAYPEPPAPPPARKLKFP